MAEITGRTLGSVIHTRSLPPPFQNQGESRGRICGIVLCPIILAVCTWIKSTLQ